MLIENSSKIIDNLYYILYKPWKIELMHISLLLFISYILYFNYVFYYYYCLNKSVCMGTVYDQYFLCWELLCLVICVG